MARSISYNVLQYNAVLILWTPQNGVIFHHYHINKTQVTYT